MSGDFLHPVYLGIEHYHKPPMTYWITAVSFKIFGVNPWSARFPLQLSLIIQAYFIYRIAKLLLNNEVSARYALLIYFSFLIVWISARNLTTDAYLNTFLILTSWAIFSYLFINKTKYIYLSGLFISLAFLTKITAVFVFLGSLIIYIIWEYRHRIRWSWHYPGVFVFTMALTLPWFTMLEAEGKSVLQYMLYEQSIVRYSSDSFNRNMPFYFYAGASIILCFPWLLLILSNILNLNKEMFRSKWPFFIICFLLPVTFFSISKSKLLLYILPAFWSLSIIAGHVINKISDQKIRFWLILQVTFSSLLLMAIVIVPLYEPNVQISLGLFLLSGISIPIFVTLILASTVPIKERLILLSLFSTLSFVAMSSHYLASNEASSSTGKIVAEWITANNLSTHQILIYDQLAPSFAFHLNKDIITIGKRTRRELQFEHSNDWKHFYYDLNFPDRKEALLALLKNPTVLITRNSKRDQIDSDLLEIYGNQFKSGLWTVFY